MSMFEQPNDLSHFWVVGVIDLRSALIMMEKTDIFLSTWTENVSISK